MYVRTNVLFAVFAIILISNCCYCNYKGNIDSVDKLREVLSEIQTAKFAFYTSATYVSVRNLFRNITINPIYTNNNDAIIQGVLNGTFLVGSVPNVLSKYKDDLNFIESNIISPNAVFTLPDNTTEYPYGANESESRRDFLNAINLAIIRVQASSVDLDLAQKHEHNIIDVRTCKIDNTDEFPIPNRKDAKGLLRKILDDKKLLVASFGPDNSTDNNEFEFHVDYLNSVVNEFSKLSGPDGEVYGNITIEKVYATSSTANILRGRVHMSEPYFLVDNVYSGTKEKCDSDADCIVTINGREKCTSNKCTAYPRAVSEVFKISCFTYGTETFFITKKSPTESETKKSTTGLVAAIVVLSLLIVATIAILVVIIYREKRGNPIFRYNNLQVCS